MSRTTKYPHPQQLTDELLGMMGSQDEVSEALTGLLALLSGDRPWHQWNAGYIPAGIADVFLLFGEASYAASGIKIYAAEATGLDPAVAPNVSLWNSTQSTGPSSGSISTWTSGLGNTDLDLDLAQGDEFFVLFHADVALTFNVNVKLTPASVLDMEQYPAEFRTEED